ncbi:MAG: hypothetical protein ABJB61_13655 [bacterium]
MNSSTVRRGLVQTCPDQSPQRNSILFRPHGKLFPSLPGGSGKIPINSTYSVTPKRPVNQCSARLAQLLEARADHGTIFHSVYGSVNLGRRTLLGSAGFRATDSVQCGSDTLQEITSTQWQKN